VNNVNNVNALPIAQDDTFGMDENTQLTGALLGNDDLGDESTTVTNFDNVSVNGGAVTFDAAGNFTYTPVADFAGADTFTYTITDADGDTSTAAVTINVNNVNALPIAQDDTFGMDENTQLTAALLGNDDLGDESTTVTNFDNVSVNGGAVTVDAAGNFTYTPAADFVGEDTFTYTITDADGDTSTAAVTINVNALPIAQDDTFGMDENTQLSGTLLSNDDLGDTPTTVTEINGNDLAFADDGYATFTIIDGVITPVTTADVLLFDNLTFNGATDNGLLQIKFDGTFTYENKGFLEGSDYPNFEYTIKDSNGDVSKAEVTIEVTTSGLIANPDSNFILLNPIQEDGTAARSRIKGNVVADGSSGDKEDESSVDGFGSPILTQVVFGTTTHTFTTETILQIDTDYGTLLINDEGAYRFQTNSGMAMPSTAVDLKFSYTIQDGDTVNPETAEADLTINIAPPPDEETLKAPEPSARFIDLDETSGSIDTFSHTQGNASLDEGPHALIKDMQLDLSDVLADTYSDNLDKYFDLGADNQKVALNFDFETGKGAPVEQGLVLNKAGPESEEGAGVFVTNGLLIERGMIISDVITANPAPLPEFDTQDVL
jgi:hypothetical protein